MVHTTRLTPLRLRSKSPQRCFPSVHGESGSSVAGAHYEGGCVHRDDHVGDVIGDLNRRRGMIKNQEAGVTGVRVKADVPLAEMFGYIGHLRTMTSGRGQFSMEFSHYSPCPSNVSEEVIAAAKEKKAPK